MLVGYGRVSSSSQHLDIQHEALAQAGCEKVFSEKMSGRSTDQREQLALALDFVREGDTLVVTRLDSLARSVGGRLDIGHNALTLHLPSANPRVDTELGVQQGE